MHKHRLSWAFVGRTEWTWNNIQGLHQAWIRTVNIYTRLKCVLRLCDKHHYWMRWPKWRCRLLETPRVILTYAILWAVTVEQCTTYRCKWMDTEIELKYHYLLDIKISQHLCIYTFRKHIYNKTTITHTQKQINQKQDKTAVTKTPPKHQYKSSSALYCVVINQDCLHCLLTLCKLIYFTIG